jgi:alkylhydroperoxidase family enzyme
MDAVRLELVLYCHQLRSRKRVPVPDNETKIKLIEDRDATGEVAQVYDEWRAKSGRQQMPGILKCFSHRPDFLREVMQFSDTVHFSEGHLNRRTKEAIASWVSWLNRCPY